MVENGEKGVLVGNPPMGRLKNKVFVQELGKDRMVGENINKNR